MQMGIQNKYCYRARSAGFKPAFAELPRRNTSCIGASKSPVFGRLRQTGLDRVVFDIGRGGVIVALIADSTVEIIRLPKCSAPTDGFITGRRSERLPRVDHVGQRIPSFDSN